MVPYTLDCGPHENHHLVGYNFINKIIVNLQVYQKNFLDNLFGTLLLISLYKLAIIHYMYCNTINFNIAAVKLCIHYSSFQR